VHHDVAVLGVVASIIATAAAAVCGAAEAVGFQAFYQVRPRWQEVKR